MPVSQALGVAGVVKTTQGPIHYRDTGPGPVDQPGSGTTLLMQAGFLASGDLWLPVVPGLHANGFRVLTVDPPSGSQPEPMNPDADLTPPGMANILGEVIDLLGVRLDIDKMTVVANDSGCAVTQLFMLSDHPATARLEKVVFATGDFFEHFPPTPFKPLLLLPKIPGGVTATIKALRVKAIWQAPTSFGWLTNEPLPQPIRDAFLGPALEHKGVRDDVTKVLRGIDAAYTLAAAEQFTTFGKPVLFVWAAADKFFPPSDADRAAELLPNATVVMVPGARTFVMWDKPGEVIDAITAFHA